MITDIIIVNWNSGKLLQQCVDSILQTPNEAVVKNLIIIDNHSSDDSLLMIQPHPKVTVIRNPQNSGFSKACNQGFKLASAPFVLLLNPDMQLFEDTLEKSIAFLEAHADVDIMGCALLDAQQHMTHSCARFPTPLRFLYQGLGLCNFFPKWFTPPLLMFDWDHKDSRYVDQVMGAFMFMRKEIFQKVGYFDERFFVYFEELDFSKRLSELGGKTFFNADIKAIHIGEGTTVTVKAFRLFLYLKSKLHYSKKHFSTPGYALVILSTFSVEFIARIILPVVRGRFNDGRQVVIAYFKFMKSLF